VPHAETARLLGDLPDAVEVVVRRGVARREIELLVEERIVGDVHLAIHAEQGPVRVDDCRGVSIHAACLPLEDRNDQNDAELFRHLLQGRRGRSRNRLGDVEPLVSLRLREVRRVEQLLQANDLRTARRRFPDARDRGLERELQIVGRGILNDPDSEGRVHAGKLSTQNGR
jgi:hypothetical protein